MALAYENHRERVGSEFSGPGFRVLRVRSIDFFLEGLHVFRLVELLQILQLLVALVGAVPRFILVDDALALPLLAAVLGVMNEDCTTVRDEWLAPTASVGMVQRLGMTEWDDVYFLTHVRSQFCFLTESRGVLLARRAFIAQLACCVRHCPACLSKWPSPFATILPHR